MNYSRFRHVPPSPYSASDRVLIGIRIAFIVICCAVAILPLIGMIWAPTNETSENRELASMPSIVEGNGANINYLSDLGNYFEDHFAYRSMFATANATLSTQLRTSANPEVVVLGEDGWLYYKDTTNNYLGQDLISPREANNIAFNLAQIRDYCSLFGARFAVTFAPNKNTIYPQHMPYYMGKPGEKYTFEMLAESLAANQVSYFDAYAQFKGIDNVYYYQRDSHWNSDGARIVAENLLRKLGENKAAEKISKLTGEWKQDYIGDLNIMLYPDNAAPEYDAHFESQLSWGKEEGETIEDAWIKTTSGESSANGTLIMYRDSFGNNMIQFLADAFDKAYFTKNIPFDLTLVPKLGATDVILEYVERNLKEFCKYPAIMPSMTVNIPDNEIDKAAIDNVQNWKGVACSEKEGFGVVEGCIPTEYANETTTEIFVGVESGGKTTWYVPFKVTIDGNDFGYRAFTDNESLKNANKVSVVVNSGGKFKLVQKTN